MTQLILKQEVFCIIGAAIAVHRELGSGFLEAVYQEAVEIELSQRSMPFEAQKQLHIYYRGIPLQKVYIADIVCYSQIIVELKALNDLTDRETAQLLHYLKANHLNFGPLINFGITNKLQWRHIVR
ncbi:MAG TPA: GxxExxY protein [Roseiflexaceae bacterium]|nr:GxxExxY protein [Roseiflexaceae bacterium]